MGNDCKDESCCCKEGYCEMSSGMMCLADKAWGDLMAEKMKKLWEKERGSNMDAAAEVIVKHSMATWKHRMEKQDMKANLPQEEIDKFREELGKVMSN